MFLERLAPRARYEVVAVCDDEGEYCQVTSFLETNKSDRQAKRMSALLMQFVPLEGPSLHNALIAKHLDDGIHHFKRHPKTGKGVRVLWFRDGALIICTEAIFKRDDNLKAEIKRAKQIRTRYEEAKRLNTIRFI